MITGNIGDWSELYALLKLLLDRKLYSADAELNKLSDVYSPLLRVFRKEFESEDIEYRLTEKKHLVELYINGDKIKTIESDWLKSAVNDLYDGILAGDTKGAFAIPAAAGIMKEMHCEKIKASSDDKTDIRLQIHDANTGYDKICGFSIKSNLGAAPSLFNASLHTNFVYEIIGLSDEDMEVVNNINSRNKIIDRIAAIGACGGEFKYVRVDSDIFSQNIMFIDSMMDDILGFLTLLHYTSGVSDLTDAVTKLEEMNPLGYARNGLYRYKLKKFLSAVALGMVPSKLWDGRDEANGGYIVVKEDGDVVAYHLYNRDSFETYLLNNTKFERSSTTRHKYATLYKEGSKMYIKLNLQVRFK